ncbi:hypothetical protein [Embleya sp. NPDC005575]|uniref:hypothetical protein n=1 Tax=Embleya sp. NPDC005575 TaxID=3156892 RepID=UPI0033AD1DDE
MTRTLIDAFFTVTDEERQIGYAIQGGRVARWDWNAEKALDADAALLSRRWPQLPESFTEGFDATLTTPGDNPWTWVFRSERCLRLNPLDGSVAEVGTISARFPGLPAVFTAGLDAALPSLTANRVHLFRGDQCALYDLRASNLIEVKSLADTWSGLAAKAPEFTAGISAATFNPKTGSCYLFRGGQYTRGNLATRVIDLDASAVDNTSWVGLIPAFSRGHIITSGSRIYSLDLETRTVTSMDWAHGVGRVEVSPDGRYIHFLRELSYGPRWQCRDMTTGREVATDWGPPRRMAFSPDGSRTYFVPAGTRDLRAVGLHPPVNLSDILLDDSERTSDAADVPGSAPESGSGSPAPVDWTSDPAPVVLSPDARRVYAAPSQADGRSIVYEVDLDESVMRQAFALPGPSPVADLAVSADGRLLHVALSNGVCALDLLTGEVVLQDKLPACTAIALTPDKRELWCLPTASNSGILVADPADHRLLRRIPIGGRGGLGTASVLAFSHFGTYAYTIHATSGTVAIIDAGCHRKIASIRIPDAISGIAYTQY